MKIVVYGLGIIGASFAAALKRAGHTVYGKNRSERPVKLALQRGMIDAKAESYEGAEVVILAIPPVAAMRELEEGAFPGGCIVADICGVKECIERVVCSASRIYRYVGTHPMAGKETSGIESADDRLFEGKNFIVTECAATDPEAVEIVCSLAKDVGFSRIVRCSAREHDRKIALTSQLAHIVTNAYGKSSLADSVSGFTGGSFQDMTRVGGVDEALWTELYLLNSEALLDETQALIHRLEAYCTALRAKDGERLRALLLEGRLAHERCFSEK